MTDIPEEDESQRLEELLTQRELPFMEDARVLERYIRRLSLSQAECARRLGRSQAAVANRLRLLKLPGDVADALSAAGLTERHARALLRLSTEEQQRQVLRKIRAEGWNVAKTEACVDALVSGQDSAEELYLPLLQALRELRDRAPEVRFSLEEESDAIFFHIRLPKETDSEKN